MNGQTAGAVAIGSPMARLKSLGLEGIRGPGAWRRPDESRTLAADALPTPGSATQVAPVASATKSETITP
jgi:hypothetical protein